MVDCDVRRFVLSDNVAHTRISRTGTQVLREVRVCKLGRARGGGTRRGRRLTLQARQGTDSS